MALVSTSSFCHGRVSLSPLFLLSLLSLAPLCSCIFNSIGPQKSLKVVKYGSGSFFSPLSTLSDDVSRGGSSASPKVPTGFPGITAYQIGNNATEPSDMAVAVGGGFVVQAVNIAIRVFNATNGKPLTDVTTLSKFLNFGPEFQDYLSDPRVYYDHLTKRFFVFIVAFPGYYGGPYKGDYSFQIVAVSKSSNPLEGFYYYKYNSDLLDSGSLHTAAGVCPCFPDYNQVGFDQYGVHISANSFSLVNYTFVGVVLQAISKRDLVQGKARPSAVRFDGSSKSNGFILQGTFYSNPPTTSVEESSASAAYTVQPATIPTNGLPDLSNGGTQYFLSSLVPYTLRSSNESLRKLDVWVMTNTKSLTSSKPKLTVRKKTIYVKPYLPGLFRLEAAVQKEGYAPRAKANGFKVYKLDTGDNRMQQVVFSNGTLMGAFSTLYKDATNKNTLNTGITYVIISVSFSSAANKLNAKKLHDGLFTIPGSYVFYPAITFNKNRAMVTFGFSGKSYYPSVGAFFVQKSKPYRVSNYTIVYRGKGPEDGFSGDPDPYFFSEGGVARWGDYFASCVDEKDDFWLAGGTILGGKRNEDTNWGSYIAKVSGK